MNQKVDMGDLYNRIKMSSQSQQVIDHVEKLHSGLFNATWYEMYKYTNGNPALAAVMALKATHWMPTQSHPAAQYLFQPSNVLGKLEMTRLLAQNVQAVRDSIQAGKEVPDTINLDSVLKALSASNFSINAEDMNEVVRGFSSIVAQTYNEYQAKGLSKLQAAQRTQRLFGGIPGNAEMSKVLEPSATVMEDLLKRGTPSLEAESDVAYRRAEAERLADLVVPKRAPESEINAFANRAHQIEVGKRLSAQLDALVKFYGGPVGMAGKFAKMRQVFESKDLPAAYNDFKADLEHWTPALTVALTGTQVGPREQEFKKQFPDLEVDTTRDFQAHVRQTLKNLQDTQLRHIQMLTAQNYVVPSLSAAGVTPLPSSPTDVQADKLLKKYKSTSPQAH